MVRSAFENIQVMGITAAVPKQQEDIQGKYRDVFGNDAVASFCRSVGVLERRVASERQTASDFAFVAARELIEKKSIDKDQIGILVFVTQTPDYRVPATACVLHQRLGLSKDCLAFDVNLGCSGYVYGMQIVCSLLNTTNSKYALLLVGDTSNKEIAPEDKASVMLFGDSGSATLLRKQEDCDNDTIRTVYRTDGKGFKSIIIPAGGTRNIKASHERTVWGDGNRRSDYDLYMNGIDVFAFTISEVPALINEYFEGEVGAKDAYDAYIFHQANCYILKQIIKRCKLPKDRVPISMDRYGNTSVTSIPLTICDKYGKEKERKKRRLFSCGYGIGLSWGIADFIIDQGDVFPILETDEYYEDGGVSHD